MAQVQNYSGVKDLPKLWNHLNHLSEAIRLSRPAKESFISNNFCFACRKAMGLSEYLPQPLQCATWSYHWEKGISRLTKHKQGEEHIFRFTGFKLHATKPVSEQIREQTCSFLAEIKWELDIDRIAKEILGKQGLVITSHSEDGGIFLRPLKPRSGTYFFDGSNCRFFWAALQKEPNAATSRGFILRPVAVLCTVNAVSIAGSSIRAGL